MSPEQFRDARSVTAASDLYSLGVVLYELVSGRLPFLGDSLGALCAAHLSELPLDLRELAPHVPADLAALIARCLRKSATARPTAAELAAELHTLAERLGEGTALFATDRTRAPSSSGLLETLSANLGQACGG